MPCTYRTKDSAWVYSCLHQSLPEALSFAENFGQPIKVVTHVVSEFNIYYRIYHYISNILSD